MARDTFASFLAKSAAPAPGTHDYAVKVDLLGGIGPSELVWLKPFALRGHDVVGSIANTPETRTEFKQGQLIAVNRDDVIEWMYRDGETRKGNFTGCALLAHEAAAERDRAPPPSLVSALPVGRAAPRRAMAARERRPFPNPPRCGRACRSAASATIARAPLQSPAPP